ncbi:alpha/beta hydrolase [Streptomyces buecherae]|uniref:alpha/beta hydrolase n=2 Tax=Streptomyces TaxID=1883 RepID=UPI001C2605F6|nr:alpha/beta hydrolase [Streptomyces buecherae]
MPSAIPTSTPAAPAAATSTRTTPPRARRAATTAALAASIAALIPPISPLSPLSPLSPISPSAAHAASRSGAAPRPTIDFGPCPASLPSPPPGERVECGTVRVPLDWQRPTGPALDIAVSRVRASGTAAERRGALLVNPGGPGGSGLPYAVTKRAKLPEQVRRAYDVVGFDPRGVGHSAPADCGPMGGLFASPGADPLPTDAAGERRHLTALRDLADDCSHGAGPAALGGLSTEATARDMDAIRAALGEPRTHFLGVSYGSYLGAAYATLFPDRAGRMVLDSVVGPWSWHDFDVRQAAALLRQREVLFGWLAGDPGRYGLGESAGQVRAAYARARERLAARPVDGFGPAEFDRAVYRALGRTERWAPLGDGLRDYLRTSNVAKLRPPAPFGDAASRNYEAANRVVKCADGPGPSPRRVVADLRELRRLDPYPLVTGLEASACAYWHHRPRHRTPLGGPRAASALLVASEHDPVTPLAGARQLAARLPGARLVTLRDDYAHGVFASRGNPCVDRATTAYLLTGDLPAADVTCRGAGLPEHEAR